MAVAFFEGNDKDGWENTGPNGWNYYVNENMTVFIQGSSFKGAYLKRDYAIFGQIYNLDIENVKVAGNDELFVDAKIITTKSGRYFFKLGDYVIAQGLSKDGEIIDRQGG